MNCTAHASRRQLLHPFATWLLPAALLALPGRGAAQSSRRASSVEVVARLADAPARPIPCGRFFFRQVLRYELVVAIRGGGAVDGGAVASAEIFAVHDCGLGADFRPGQLYHLWLEGAVPLAASRPLNRYGSRARPLWWARRAVPEPSAAAGAPDAGRDARIDRATPRRPPSAPRQLSKRGR